MHQTGKCCIFVRMGERLRAQGAARAESELRF